MEIFPGRKKVGEFSFHIRGTRKRKTKRKIKIKASTNARWQCQVGSLKVRAK
jgi:hypothetical protein